MKQWKGSSFGLIFRSWNEHFGSSLLWQTLCHDYPHSVSKGHLGRHRISLEVEGFQVVLSIHSSELKLHFGDCRMKNCTFFFLVISLCLLRVCKQPELNFASFFFFFNLCVQVHVSKYMCTVHAEARRQVQGCLSSLTWSLLDQARLTTTTTGKNVGSGIKLRLHT